MATAPRARALGAYPPAFIKYWEAQAPLPTPDAFHALSRQVARAAENRELSSVEAERYWFSLGLAFIQHEPWAWLKLEGRKLIFLAPGPDAHDLSEVRAAEDRLSHLPLLSSALLGALGLAGLLLLLLERRKLSLLVPYAAATLGSCVLFYVISRYRTAALPLFAVLTAGGLMELTALRARPSRVLRTLLVVLSVFVIQRTLPLLRNAQTVLQRAQEGGERFSQALAWRAQGKAKEANAAFSEALGVYPPLLLTRDVRAFDWTSAPVLVSAGSYATKELGLGTDADIYFAAELAARAWCLRQRHPGPGRDLLPLGAL